MICKMIMKSKLFNNNLIFIMINIYRAINLNIKYIRCTMISTRTKIITLFSCDRFCVFIIYFLNYF